MNQLIFPEKQRETERGRDRQKQTLKKHFGLPVNIFRETERNRERQR